MADAKGGLRPVSMADSDTTTVAHSAVPSIVEPEKKDHVATTSTSAASPSQSTRGQSPTTADEKETVAAEKGANLEVDEKAAKRLSQTSAVDDDDDFDYPKKWKLTAITLALCLSVFCMALDNTIIATAIPRITDQFKALNDVGWYGSAYLLTTCATQLIYGKIYTFYSIKWVYLFALFIFEVGSLICGVAPNSTTLIIGRAVAGVGAAGIFSGAILIVALTVPLRQRPVYMGILGGMYGIASVAGPLLGGVFTDKLTWRWCFYINLPFGGVTAAFIIPFFSITRRGAKATGTWREQLRQLDLWGAGVFFPCVICLLLALQWGGSKYEWKSGRIIALLVLTGVLAIAFVAIQAWKQETATVPPRIFLNRNVWGCALFGALLGAAFFLMVYYLPIWFQAIKGASAVKSGIMNLPVILSLVIVSMMAGGAVTATGYYTPFMLASSVFMAIGAGLLTTFETDTGHAKWIGYQFIFGTGVGLGMQQILVAVQTVLPKEDIAVGTAVMMFSQTLGGALFISVGQNVFTNSLIKNLKSAVPGIDPEFVLSVGATALKDQVPREFIGGVLTAYNKTLTQTFYVSTATAALSIVGAAFVQWKSMKGKDIQMAAA